MKKILFLLSFSFCSFVFSQEKRPNIIIFLVDDMGWQDTSVPFSEEKTPNNEKFHTPQMERLASQGIQFTRAYATPVCSPSRVSLVTGSNAARHRVTNWTLKKDTATDVADEEITPPSWNVNGISPIENQPNSYFSKTLPQLLKEVNYYTICIGKAHFGAKGTLGENPLELGFEKNIAGHAAGGLADYSGLKNFGHNPDGTPYSDFAIPDLEKYWQKDISVTEALTQEALAVLENRPKDRPFFLYLSHYAVHTPMQADMRFYPKYIEKNLPEKEARYASMVEAMDKSLGNVLDFLKKNNLEENTLLLFLSDNGGLSALERAGQAHTHNFPLNSGKGSVYEGGVRIPMLAQWRGTIPDAVKTKQRIIIEDFFPTLLEVAQVKKAEIPQKVDGKSFLKTLFSPEKQKDRTLFWHIPNNWFFLEGHGFGAASAMLHKNWKLIYYYKTQTFELFDLESDLGETQDISKENPQKVKQLSRKLTKHLKKTQAQLPILKKTGKIASYPTY